METGLPMTHLSRICAMSIGEDYDAAEVEADPAWQKETGGERERRGQGLARRVIMQWSCARGLLWPALPN